jgi:3-oxoacyl-[acyl-carrier-protein] synthase II
VTGLGVVSSIGIGKEAFWDSLIHGRSGVSHVTRFDCSKLPVDYAAEVKDFKATDYMDELQAEMYGRYVHFAVAGVKLALKDAGIEAEKYDKSRLSMYGGATAPAVDQIEKLFLFAMQNDPLTAPPYALAAVGMHLATGEAAQCTKLFDSSTTVSTYCTSGLNSIAMGLEDIRRGRKDIVVAGATDSHISYYTFICYILAGMILPSEGVPPEKIMRPYDKNRKCGVISEGAGFVVLEELEHARRRGAHIYCEIAGHAYKDKSVGAQATRQTMTNAMRGALENAHLLPGSIDCVFGNGNSTIVQDKAETQALKEVFGDYAYRLPISAIKSVIGIPNSAAGPMQLIAASLAFEDEMIPPTINYETPDPDCDLDYVPNVARCNRVNVTMVNNLGLDGACAVLIARRYQNGDSFRQ